MDYCVVGPVQGTALLSKLIEEKCIVGTAVIECSVEGRFARIEDVSTNEYIIGAGSIDWCAIRVTWTLEEVGVPYPVRDIGVVFRKHRTDDDICICAALDFEKLLKPVDIGPFIVIDERDEVDIVPGVSDCGVSGGGDAALWLG